MAQLLKRTRSWLTSVTARYLVLGLIAAVLISVAAGSFFALQLVNPEPAPSHGLAFVTPEPSRLRLISVIVTPDDPNHPLGDASLQLRVWPDSERGSLTAFLPQLAEPKLLPPSAVGADGCTLGSVELESVAGTDNQKISMQYKCTHPDGFIAVNMLADLVRGISYERSELTIPFMALTNEFTYVEAKPFADDWIPEIGAASVVLTGNYPLDVSRIHPPPSRVDFKDGQQTLSWFYEPERIASVQVGLLEQGPADRRAVFTFLSGAFLSLGLAIMLQLSLRLWIPSRS